MTVTLSGSELAAGIRAEATAAAADLTAAGTPPRLAVVVATADESSAWYVRAIARATERAAIEFSIIDLGETATPEQIRGELARLSADRSVHGIILQTPLPDGALLEDLDALIDPANTSTAPIRRASAGWPPDCRPSPAVLRPGHR